LFGPVFLRFTKHHSRDSSNTRFKITSSSSTNVAAVSRSTVASESVGSQYRLDVV
jgi:hypothetical protein